jgi:hypothetical protein
VIQHPSTSIVLLVILVFSTGEDVVDPVSKLVVSPNGFYAATCHADDTVVLWNLEKRSMLYRLPGNAKGPVAFSEDSAHIAIRHGSDGFNRVYLVTEGREICSWQVLPANEFGPFWGLVGMANVFPTGRTHFRFGMPR